MKNTLFKVLAVTATLCGASLAPAQDAGPLLDALVRKGILSDQEAEELRADVARESSAAVVSTVSGGKSTNTIAISGRIQMQYAALSSDQTAPDTNQFFLRRVYFGVNAGVGAKWLAVLNYDFSGGNFDKAYMEWSGYWGSEPIALDFGLRKVNFGYEETTSSASLKSIERSPVTRFFVEPNNGRRLGAGAHHIGAFLDGGSVDSRKGKSTGYFYGAAVTNPQRTETTGDATPIGSKSAGGAEYNVPAMWANVGYTKIFSADKKVVIGAGYGFLPDQGGASNTNRGKGFDANVYSIYADGTYGRFNLAGEYLWGKVDRGVSALVDAKPEGFWIQPSYAVSEKLEVVSRYSCVDADGRGIRTSDGIRSAPGSKTNQNLEEFYLGLNYYFVNQDVKLQLGYIDGSATGGATEENVKGVRSQLQITF